MFDIEKVYMVSKFDLGNKMEDSLENFEEENMVNDMNATCVSCAPEDYDADDMSCNARIARWMHEYNPDIEELWVRVEF